VTDERRDTCDLLCLDLPHAEEIRAGLPELSAIEEAAAAARALGDPAQNLTSHHLRQLKIGGLVSARRDGRLVMYALTGRGRALVSSVLTEDRASRG